MPVILATWEAETRRITVRGQNGQIAQETPTSKIIRPKWTGSVAKVVECLLYNHKVLSSLHVNQNKTKQNKKTQNYELLVLDYPLSLRA
jgi:hypothetical protein